MIGALKRGACPSLSEPMLTGDGLLVRLNSRGGMLRPAQLGGIARAAARHGNGVLEVTARGSLQIRGLSAATLGALAADIAALDIDADEGTEIRTGPLAGRDAHEIADPRPLADAIRLGLERRSLNGRLAPKVSVVVDGGGTLGLGGLSADVRLEAVTAASRSGDTPHLTLLEPPPLTPPHKGEGDFPAAMPRKFAGHRNLAERRQGPPPPCGEGLGVGVWAEPPAAVYEGSADVPNSAAQWRLAVGGNVGNATLLWQGDGVAAVAAALDCLAVLAEAGLVARARDLPGEAFARAAAGLSVIGPGNGGEGRRPETPVGEFALRDGIFARGFALPFGQIASDRLAAFAAGLAPEWEARLAPGRGLMVLGLSPRESGRLIAPAKDSGLVTDADDPRLRIVACAGAPSCFSAHLPTKSIAAAIVGERPDLLEAGAMLHISGCAKKCARPAGPAVALVGSQTGCEVEGDGMPVDAATRRTLKRFADRFAPGWRRSA